jgi:hypothetical protein
MKDHTTSERIPMRGRLPSAGGRILWITVVAALVSCQQRGTTHRNLPGRPTVAATVLTIQTTIQPENKTYVHSLVIADDRARSGDEVDQWRLFDLHDDSVTFVDEIAHTYRRQSMASIVDDLNAALTQPLPEGMPRVALVRTGAHRVIQGVDATEVQLRAGSYVRQMWIAKHPLIPPKLFAMMLASAPSRSPLLPMMSGVNEALLGTDGFPLSDHAELGFDTNKKLVIDETVVKIERRNVPQSWLNVSAAYRDITPAPPAPARPNRTK